MKELKSILSRYHEVKNNCNKLIIATVVNVEGSSYRRAGARMLIMKNGEWIGGISGGCLEGDLLKKAKLVYENNVPLLVKYDTTENDLYQIGLGLGCKGVIDILLSPINTKSGNNILDLLTTFLGSRNKKTIVHFIDYNRNLLELPTFTEFNKETSLDNFNIQNSTKKSLIKDIAIRNENQVSGLSEYIEENNKLFKVFIEVLPPNMLIYICGNGYDTIPFLELCNNLAWDIKLICKPSKINKYQHKLADNIFDIKSPNLSFNNADQYSYLICMSHDYKTDLLILEKAIQSNISYIGLLGPKNRGAQIIEDIKQSNPSVDVSLFEKVFYPTGLDIGAKQPEEIAISIIAELIAHRENRNGGMLTNRKIPIHNRS